MTALEAARLAWSIVRSTTAVQLRSCAREAIALAKDPSEEEAIATLTERLRADLPVAIDRAGFSGARPDAEAAATPLADGMLRFDARFAQHLASIGATGRVAAEQIRDKARGRWKAFAAARDDASLLWSMWIDEDRAFACALAYALWLDVVRPALVERRSKPAALVRPVYLDIAEFHSPLALAAYNADDATLTFEGRQLAHVVNVGDLDMQTIVSGLKQLGSIAAHRLVRMEILTAHERMLRGVPFPNTLTFDGGWSALTRAIGLGSKDEGRVREIVYAQAHWRFTFPDGARGTMLQYVERPARGQRRACVEITLGPQLLPNYICTLPRRAERKLVPMLRSAPPLYGRSNEHGAQMTMSLRLLAELRARARELVTEGGVVLSFDDWTRLGDRSGVPRSRKLIVNVAEHWIAGDTKAPPLLVRLGRDRYTLSDAHAVERAFLETGGRIELAAAEQGKRAAATRRAHFTERCTSPLSRVAPPF